MNPSFDSLPLVHQGKAFEFLDFHESLQVIHVLEVAIDELQQELQSWWRDQSSWMVLLELLGDVMSDALVWKKKDCRPGCLYALIVSSISSRWSTTSTVDSVFINGT